MGRRLPRGSSRPKGPFRRKPLGEIADMLANGDDPLALYQLAYALFVPASQRKLLAPRRSSLTDGCPSDARTVRSEMNSEKSPVIGLLERALFLGERLLPIPNAASMSDRSKSLPLVDQVLVENVERLPAAFDSIPS